VAVILSQRNNKYCVAHSQRLPMKNPDPSAKRQMGRRGRLPYALESPAAKRSSGIFKFARKNPSAWVYLRAITGYSFAMPTVFRIGATRVVTYPNDHRPAHVHVIGLGKQAVFNMHCSDGPPAVGRTTAFRRSISTFLRAGCRA
jgi:hypothetical protein